MSVSTESRAGPSDQGGVVTWDLSMTPKTESHLNQLARDIGGSREDVFRLALSLLAVAVRAKQDGKKLALIDEQGNIDTESTAF
jgi:hypothetical protein